ncbi:hypothetical protein Cgig2_020810 [Carnegiea gigantea]|uniref:Retrovirus-related Pol polyprotein from transposon TNT 1-94-like beta-barrel domain-containing protein n=1 Tax=Carnegiea gigantea TaxID=171969 RepID=A0A9Q1KJF6_9CARY|nr:hypothetical protein Cgig2_020810 [Carnegiea gigantea]
MAASISSLANAMKSLACLRLHLGRGRVPPSISALLSSQTQALLKPSFFKIHLNLIIFGSHKTFAAAFSSLCNNNSNNNEGVSGSDSELHSRPSLKWVISSGVSGHVTPIESVLENKIVLPVPISVIWVDGRVVSGSLMGDVTISRGITLKDVLYAPDVKEPYLSVGKLLWTSPLKVLFDDGKCMFTDEVTGDTVAVGHADGKGRFLLDVEDVGCSKC